MNKIGKWIIWALIAAFLLGFLPTIIDTLADFFVLTEEGLGVTQHFTRTFNEIAATIESYMWHIIIIYSIIIAFIIFMEGQNPDRTILWMLVLILVPVLGVVLYLVLGPDLQSIRNRRLFRPAKKYSFDHSPFKKAAEDQFLIGRMLHACSGADLLMRNRVEILINGGETFPAMEAAIAGARKFIYMEFFIIRDDALGRKIGGLLMEAARRGVKVRVLYDAVGSWSLKAGFVKELEEAGVECRSFMPVSLPLFRRKMNFRNHRKILVIDRRVAFTGGINIGEEYEGKGPLGFWRDTFVRLEGEAVPALHAIFLHDWCVRSADDPAAICEDLDIIVNGLPVKDDYSDLPVIPLQVVESGIDSVWHSIAKGYYGMISRAQRRVWVTSPYLVPGPELMNALIASSLSGVDVRVMMPSVKDHFLVFWGSRSNIEPLLRAGVRVFLYQDGFIHTKSVVSDSRIASVGTCNMDVRSLDINFENQLFIYDREIAESFARQFETDMKRCRELFIGEWEKRPLWQKLLESFGRLYSAQI
ncbi:MAG: cardiolipin synthase [Synergistaceae bacterium]|nr:cardiolipin synthase [Synergistaceae bacterium]